MCECISVSLSTSNRRFCTRDTFYCRGARVDTAACGGPAPCATAPPTALTSPQQEPRPPARPTPVYGSAPCECGCTYLLHTAAPGPGPAPAREINIVSGDCSLLPITWTIKVPEDRRQGLQTFN